jgi:predicted N-formylglutamate amidohydrolase
MSVNTPVSAPLLAPGEPPPFVIVNPEGKSDALLLCEHGGLAVPRQLGALGLGPEHYTKHYAYDIGVRRMTETLARLIDAPAVIANYSRLVVDLNRAVDHPTAFPVTGEGAAIPGNVTMTAADRALRIVEIYEPFHAAVTRLIDARVAAGRVPRILALHSYTPVFFGERRPWDCGMLWLQDDRLARPLIGDFRGRGYNTGDNEPYDARAMWGTAVNIHGDARRLPNVLVEVRHDHIDTDEKSDLWAKMLGDSLQTVLEDPGLARYYEGPQHEFDPEAEHRHFTALADRVRGQS